MSELDDYRFKIEHKKGKDNILVDALSSLNLPNCEEEDITFQTAYVKKIINSVGLQYESEIEILEFHDMINALEESIEEPDPFKLNSFEFFIQELSFFEGEAKGTVGSSEPDPASPVKSADSRFEINPNKSEILGKSRQYGWNQLLESMSSREESPDSSLEESWITIQLQTLSSTHLK